MVGQWDELLFGYPVTVVSGKGYVEVKLLGVNKGKAVEKILKTLTTLHGDVDFVLCIGDDRSDEDMFAVINDWTVGEGFSLTKNTGPNSSSLITHTGRENRIASQGPNRTASFVGFSVSPTVFLECLPCLLCCLFVCRHQKPSSIIITSSSNSSSCSGKPSSNNRSGSSGKPSSNSSSCSGKPSSGGSTTASSKPCSGLSSSKPRDGSSRSSSSISSNSSSSSSSITSSSSSSSSSSSRKCCLPFLC
ncbi:hypothetical protein ACSSS7_008084 [Eimeria intestinalis]